MMNLDLINLLKRNGGKPSYNYEYSEHELEPLCKEILEKVKQIHGSTDFFSFSKIDPGVLCFPDSWDAAYEALWHIHPNKEDVTGLERLYELIERISQKIIPLGLISVDYNRLSDKSWQEFEKLSIEPKRKFKPEFKEDKLASIIPVIPAKYMGFNRLGISLPMGKNWFLLTTEFIMSNNFPEEICVDFGDGLGERILATDIPLPVEYKQPGTYDVIFTYYYRDGKKLTSVYRQEIYEACRWTGEITVEGKIPFRNKCNSGRMTYLLVEGRKKIENPVLFVEDFPGEMDFNDMYRHLNKGKLLSKLLMTGYDIVFLKFSSEEKNYAGDYLQRNAFTLVEAICNIQQITKEKIFVGGVGTGGLIARYALTYMEKKGIDHNAGICFSLNTPHAGMEVEPLVQFYSAYSAKQSFVASRFRNLLKQPAATQVLNRQIRLIKQGDYPLLSRNTAAFFNDLKSLGNYPNIPCYALAWGNPHQKEEAYGTVFMTVFNEKKESYPCYFRNENGAIKLIYLNLVNHAQESGIYNAASLPGTLQNTNLYTNCGTVPVKSALDIRERGVFKPKQEDSPFLETRLVSLNENLIEINSKTADWITARINQYYYLIKTVEVNAFNYGDTEEFQM